MTFVIALGFLIQHLYLLSNEGIFSFLSDLVFEYCYELLQVIIIYLFRLNAIYPHIKLSLWYQDLDSKHINNIFTILL